MERRADSSLIKALCRVRRPGESEWTRKRGGFAPLCSRWGEWPGTGFRVHPVSFPSPSCFRSAFVEASGLNARVFGSILFRGAPGFVVSESCRIGRNLKLETDQNLNQPSACLCACSRGPWPVVSGSIKQLDLVKLPWTPVNCPAGNHRCGRGHGRGGSTGGCRHDGPRIRPSRVAGPAVRSSKVPTHRTGAGVLPARARRNRPVSRRSRRPSRPE